MWAPASQVAAGGQVWTPTQDPDAAGLPKAPREQASSYNRSIGGSTPDPNSVYQWLRHVAIDSSLAVGFDLKFIDATAASSPPQPFVYLTGHRDPKFSDDEVAALRRHLESGGFLFVNNCCGRSAFDQHARALVGRLFPDQKLALIPPEHPLFQSFFTIADAHDRASNAARPIELEGITIKDRLVLIYSKNDAVTQLKQVSDPFGNGYDAETCRRIAVNVVAYALQH